MYTRETVLVDSIRVTNDETPEMSDADLVALKKAAPLIKEMLIAVDKELESECFLLCLPKIVSRIEQDSVISVYVGISLVSSHHRTS
jgi:hypothetical protein